LAIRAPRVYVKVEIRKTAFALPLCVGIVSNQKTGRWVLTTQVFQTTNADFNVRVASWLFVILTCMD
jgi:hypothetical protein